MRGEEWQEEEAALFLCCWAWYVALRCFSAPNIDLVQMSASSASLFSPSFSSGTMVTGAIIWVRSRSRRWWQTHTLDSRFHSWSSLRGCERTAGSKTRDEATRSENEPYRSAV
jgi:hypothetical protein